MRCPAKAMLGKILPLDTIGGTTGTSTFFEQNFGNEKEKYIFFYGCFKLYIHIDARPLWLYNTILKAVRNIQHHDT